MNDIDRVRFNIRFNKIVSSAADVTFARFLNGINKYAMICIVKCKPYIANWIHKKIGFLTAYKRDYREKVSLRVFKSSSGYRLVSRISLILFSLQLTVSINIRNNSSLSFLRHSGCNRIAPINRVIYIVRYLARANSAHYEIRKIFASILKLALDTVLMSQLGEHVSKFGLYSSYKM